ncbi:hypothetical protein [Actinacidiphila acidipaludis]|uniref:Uncharacterized protein n=1 Tax=Actinacidiphila acidipaludis TaxID=2873382 RepID=A0ABS7QHQ7_9ACTN|nr:hypothetical protein [Streptomyces acidipaludis]MBY8882716.1 hypothetical protein [Streptomyces acidipaludis]
MAPQHEHPHQIRTTVDFALATKPYVHEYAPETTAATVLSDALTAFGTVQDGTTRYFLFHSGHEVPPDQTVRQLAGHAEALHLGLRTQTTNG